VGIKWAEFWFDLDRQMGEKVLVARITMTSNIDG